MAAGPPNLKSFVYRTPPTRGRAFFYQMHSRGAGAIASAAAIAADLTSQDYGGILDLGRDPRASPRVRRMMQFLADTHLWLSPGLAIIDGKISLDPSYVSGTNTGDQFTNETPFTLIGRNTTPAGPAQECTITNALDFLSGAPGLSVAFGSFPVRDVDLWKTVAPGTAGLALVSQGPGSLPIYGPVSVSSVTGVLAEANGGTNQSTYASGDLLYASAANTLSKLGIGATGKYLKVAAGVPSWATINIGDSIHSSTVWNIASIDDSGGLSQISPSTAGFIMTSNGTSAAATFEAIGTGSGLTAHGVVLAEGSGAFVASGTSTAGQLFIGQGATSDPLWKTVSGSGATITLASNGRLSISAISTSLLGGTGTAGRLTLSGGTAIATTDWALSAGWGANASVTAVSGNDSRGTVTVTTSVLDTPTASPTLTLTFKDGAWVAGPFCVSNMNDASTGLLGSADSSCPNTSTMRITYNGTPTALLAGTYVFNYFVIG